jgi:hypothetical protein
MTDSFPGFRKNTDFDPAKSGGSLGFAFRRFIIFLTLRVFGIGSGCLFGSGGLRSPGRARADAGSVGTFLGKDPRSLSGLVGVGFAGAFGGASRGAGAALNFDDISGRGAATAGLDAFFILKLNLLGVWDWGPVGGCRLGGAIFSSFGLSGLLLSSTWSSFEGLKGLSLLSILTSSLSFVGFAWLLGDD